ncbi:MULTISPECIES: DUF3800 domain-containing protein [unclassified Mesorhizobium]|uniref:DUF3800 domain-containing protein n=1 Tax=unclassified Mesorhizobium TaxID=325217 RepID=UPI0018DC9302|nr:DUF3800 domain-containing protein [Mesorhizobium sp. LSJC269B00]
MRLEAYIDESGDDGGFPIQIVGGYVVRPEDARFVETAWAAVLRKYGDLPYFHMVECAPEPPSGVFKGMPKERRIQLQTELMDLINRHVAFSIICSTPLGRYDGYNKDGKYIDPYTYLVGNVSDIIYDIANIYFRDCEVSLFYESGHKNGNTAYEYFNDRKIHRPRTSFSFMDKRASGMIQAADIIVWQYAKFIKDMVQSERGPRKDFRSLLTVPARIMHVVPTKDRKLTLIPLTDGDVDNGEARQLLRDIYGPNEPPEGGLFRKVLDHKGKGFKRWGNGKGWEWD